MSEEVALAAGDIAHWRMRAEQAEADAAALRHALEGTTRMLADRSNNNSRAWIWARHVIEANQRVLSQEHPAAPWLLDTAQGFSLGGIIAAAAPSPVPGAALFYRASLVLA